MVGETKTRKERLIPLTESLNIVEVIIKGEAIERHSTKPIWRKLWAARDQSLAHRVRSRIYLCDNRSNYTVIC